MTLPIRCRRRAAVLLGLAVLGCGDGGPIGADHADLRILSAAIAENPHNVLSAVVTAEALGARTVRVEVDPELGAGPRHVTPEFDAGPGELELPVLGLHPATSYVARVVATSSSGASRAGPQLPFRTGELPSSIARFEVVTHGRPEPGYTLVAPIRFGSPHPPVVLDLDGRVVWYRETARQVIDFQMQPHGRFTAGVQVEAPPPILGGIYEEWDVLGRTVATWTARGLPWTDVHEIRLLNGGMEALLLGFISAAVELGELAEAGPVVANVLQRVTRGGATVFEWSSLDHLPLSDADDFVWSAQGPAGYDLTHANAVELDLDGNYLLASRHFSEITKIDAHTGEVLWRMGGGKGNQFTFVDDPHGGFSAMHSVRRLPSGNLLVLDNGNGHAPPASRAVEYEVDERARTARLVWSYEPGHFSCCMGNAQRLQGGTTLVTLGQDHRVVEVAADGTTVWEAHLPAAGAGFFGIYRAFRIPSLYGRD